MDRQLEAELARLEAAGLRRRLAEPATPASPGVDFCSNDYLGLASDPRVVDAAREALARHGAGGRASRLLGGGSPLPSSRDCLLYTSPSPRD